MKQNIFTAIRLTFVLILLCSVFYTLLVFGVAQFTVNKGKGDIVSANGKTYYSNIAQNFSEDRYFHSRPSAVAYNASGSAGSNKGPSNPDYLNEVQGRIDTFLVHNPGIEKSEIPSDLVTASGSGLDPHISLKAAMVQAKRIAQKRDLRIDQVEALIEKHVEKPFLGLFGPVKINVLKLNLELDNQK